MTVVVPDPVSLPLPEHVAYWLPQRAAGHRPRVADAGAALAALDAFLSVHADAAPASAVRLRVHEAPAAAGERAVAIAHEAQSRATAAFGAPAETERVECTIDDVPTGTLTSWCWHGDDATLGDMRALVHSLPRVAGAAAPAVLTWERRFRWRAPSTDGVPFPAAEVAASIPASRVAITLARHVAVRPEFHFPWVEGAPGLDAFVPWLAARLPFALQGRHFVLVTPTKRGTTRVRRLVLPPLLAAR